MCVFLGGERVKKRIGKVVSIKKSHIWSVKKDIEKGRLGRREKKRGSKI